MSDEMHIRVSDVIDLAAGVVDSGRAVAQEVLAALATHARVVVVLDGLPGAPSSFFNVILHDLLEQFDPTSLTDRVVFQTSSKSVRFGLVRSLQAFKLPESIVSNSAA